MSKTPSRRRILQGAVVLPLVNFADMPHRTSAHNGCADELQSLWLRRKDLISRSCELDRLWLERRSQLPEWCLPGPKYHNSNGNTEGPIVGWPESSDPVADCDRWLLRPSPMDFRRLFNDEAATQVETACALYVNRMRLLRSRLRERRALISEVGLPASSDWKVLDTEIESIEQTILSRSASPDTTAARLIALRNRRIRSTTEDQSESDLLKASIHAYLSGETPNLSGFILESLPQDLESECCPRLHLVSGGSEIPACILQPLLNSR